MIVHIGRELSGLNTLVTILATIIINKLYHDLMSSAGQPTDRKHILDMLKLNRNHIFKSLKFTIGQGPYSENFIQNFPQMITPIS